MHKDEGKKWNWVRDYAGKPPRQHGPPTTPTKARCPVRQCGILFEKMRMLDHLAFDHGLGYCEHCKEFIIGRANLRPHIKKHHGKDALKEFKRKEAERKRLIKAQGSR